MLNKRIMPVLLLKGEGLVKTSRFKDPVYVGDPINAVHIFNTKEVDELIFLDITATVEERGIPIKLVEKISDECMMPLTVGGGIKTLDDIRELINAGVEKVCIGSQAMNNPSFIQEASNAFGSQAIVVCLDVKKHWYGPYEVFINGGKKRSNMHPVAAAKKMEEMGAGEILLYSIDRDGTMEGYDLKLIGEVSDAVNVPVIACGGAGKIEDFALAANEGKASALAAGSMFVFHGPRRAVLINFPSQKELDQIINCPNR